MIFIYFIFINQYKSTSYVKYDQVEWVYRELKIVERAKKVIWEKNLTGLYHYRWSRLHKFERIRQYYKQFNSKYQRAVFNTMKVKEV
jgi:hypothetical protein